MAEERDAPILTCFRTLGRHSKKTIYREIQNTVLQLHTEAEEFQRLSEPELTVALMCSAALVCMRWSFPVLRIV